jgi:hypothetical protein
MKKIIKYAKIVASVLACASCVQAEVFFLDGTSSVGKSGIATIIRRQEHWGVVASLYWDWSPSKLAELFPEDVAAINRALAPENFVHALRRYIIVFRQESSQEQKESSLKSIEKIRTAFSCEQDDLLYNQYMNEFNEYSFAKLQECAATKRHMLVDGSWYLKQESLLPGMVKHSVLVYCPFDVMINRIIGRNQQCFETSSVINHRFFSEGMRAFLKIYSISSGQEGAIDTIDKASVLQALQLVESRLKPAVHSAKKRYIVQEFLQEQFEEYKHDLLAKFEHSETLYVVPKRRYDLVVRTDSMDSVACAQQIINFANGKETH